jgi:hypothetical protein
MNALKTLENRIRGWIPNDYRIAFGQKVSKPSWWKPLWSISALGIVLSAFALFLVGFALDRVILGMVFAFTCLGIAYYIRVRPSLKINRLVYVCLGIGIGWVVWVIYALSGAGLAVYEAIGAYPALSVNFIFYIAGAVLGDQIGKKREYLLPLSI